MTNGTEKTLAPTGMTGVTATDAPVPSQEMSAVQAQAISKFEGASKIQLTEHEKSILFAPVDIADVQMRPDGQVYLEWAWYANRLDAAFGVMEWSVTPAPWNPRFYREGSAVYCECVLWVRGQYVKRALGYHKEQRTSQPLNFADAAEAAESIALMRCCKKMGMARVLWETKAREEIKKQILQRKNPTSPSKRETSGLATNAPAQPTTLPEGLEAQLAVLEKIRQFLIELYPGLGPVERTAKADACKRWFHATWGEMQKMSAEVLETRFAQMVKFYGGEGK